MAQIRRKKCIEHLLQTKQTHLHQLIEKSYMLSSINEIIRAFLEPALATHIQVANIQDDQLTIIADSATWATILRYQSQNLLNSLQRHPGLQHIQSISILIRPHYPQTSETHTQSWHKPHISHKNANYLRKIASHIDNDKLQKSLEKIAENAQPNQTIA